MALVPVAAWRVARRKRWLTRREHKGLLRPRPVLVLTVNCMSISTGHRQATEILRRAAAVEVAGMPVDVLLGSECDDFDGHRVLGLEWDVLHDQNDIDRDGCLLAVRASRGRLINPHLRLAARALLGGMRDRYLAIARVELDPGTKHRWAPKTVSAHGPPMRAWARWPGYMRSVVATKADMAGGDWNKLGRAVLPILRRAVHMVHIIGLATRWWIPTSGPIPIDVGGDHLAVAVILWPNTKEIQ